MPLFTCTGAYSGINAGYAFDASSGRNNNSTFRVPSPHAAAGTTATFGNRSQDGFSGGAQIGYTYQFTPGAGVVVGNEANAQYPDFGRSRNSAFINGALAPGYYVTDPRGMSSLDYFGTGRGRLGYAFDRTLVYGTGGFAYGSGSADRSFGGYAGNDSFRTGYAVGGGVEYALPTDSVLNLFRSSAWTPMVAGLSGNPDRNTRNQGRLSTHAANSFPGGFAYGSGSADRSFGGYAGTDSFRTGYAFGGGVESALPTDSFLTFFPSSAVTLKVEGLYVNLDRNTRNQGAFVINAATNFPVAYNTLGRRSDEFAVIRA
ncbi:outer membrane protein, partial [Methylobacterium sp. J-026]|uniref:outer membrane protein n=1 Tax=Methylobacterium sp. J-026 TaxID=2836624 RepID=UPI00391CB1E4